MPLFDSCVPKNLLHVQKWFGTVIAHPLIDNETDPSISVEAPRYISPSLSLKPEERIQIYNQQYWWRLINIMQEAFPCVLRLFGFEDFERSIVVPFLQKYQPHNWSLNTLGDQLPKWIREDYKGEDKQLVCDAALLDNLYNSIFFQKTFPSISTTDEGISVQRLYLQPHVTFIEFPYKMTEFRRQLLKEEPPYWVEHPFPELKKEQEHILLFRNLKGKLAYKSLSNVEWSILKLFQTGSTIDAVCEWIEGQTDAFRQEAEVQLQEWFSNWTIMGIFHFAHV